MEGLFSELRLETAFSEVCSKARCGRHILSKHASPARESRTQQVRSLSPPARRIGGLAPVGDSFYTRHTRAVGAAVEVVLCLDTVSYHLDAAVLAGWRERVDGTLEAVEGARTLAGHAYLKSLVILISTNFALGHNRLLLL